jgi:hypothetical protein
MKAVNILEIMLVVMVKCRSNPWAAVDVSFFSAQRFSPQLVAVVGNLGHYTTI